MCVRTQHTPREPVRRVRSYQPTVDVSNARKQNSLVLCLPLLTTAAPGWLSSVLQDASAVCLSPFLAGSSHRNRCSDGELAIACEGVRGRNSNEAAAAAIGL